MKLSHQNEINVMTWDAPLYAVNMFYYHWLMKNLLWPMIGQNIAGWEIQAERQGEKRQGQGDASSHLSRMPEHCR